MLVVKYKKENNIIESVSLSGHALYDVKGRDIVCAAASSIFITSVNAILKFDENGVTYSDSPEYLIKNVKKDDITNKLLDNMIDLFIELSNDYKKNIKIMEE